MSHPSIAICIPTLNAGEKWRDILIAIFKQTIRTRLLVIDSGSSDQTVDLARNAGSEIYEIESSRFDHGGTRQIGFELLCDSEIVIFMTQDAQLATPDSLEKLIKPFQLDLGVGASYGRQLPRPGATPIEAHARLFNYPAMGRVTSADDIPQMGMKAAFLSNSFAAYRRAALMDVSGFPSQLLVSEDMIVGARMLLKGWKLAYQADACVFHSHDYTPVQEFQRYFDIGALHARESWLVEKLGSPEGEGRRFVLSELRYLAMHAPWLTPVALMRTLIKYIGYRLGRMEARLPPDLKKRLSMQKPFWDREAR